MPEPTAPTAPPTPPIALAALLARTDLGLRQLAGPPDASIRWVHASEMADPYPYLLGGELLMTAGIQLGDPEAYVSRVVAAGAAALGFGVAPVYEEVPPALVAACARHGLPLLEVPPRTTFSRVARAVWLLMARAREDELRRVNEAQRALAAAASRSAPVGAERSAPVGAVLRVLAGRLGGWAALMTPAGSVVESAGAAPSAPVGEALGALVRVVSPSADRPHPAPSRKPPAGGAGDAAPSPAARQPRGTAPDPAPQTPEGLNCAMPREQRAPLEERGSLEERAPGGRTPGSQGPASTPERPDPSAPPASEEPGSGGRRPGATTGPHAAHKRGPSTPPAFEEPGSGGRRPGATAGPHAAHKRGPSTPPAFEERGAGGGGTGASFGARAADTPPEAFGKGRGGENSPKAHPLTATDSANGTHLAAYALAEPGGMALAVATPHRAPGDPTIAGVAAVLLSLLTAGRPTTAEAARSAALVRMLLGGSPGETAALLGEGPWVVVCARGTGTPPDLGTPLVDAAGPAVRALVPADREVTPHPGWALGVSAPAGIEGLAVADTQAARALARAVATRTPLARHRPAGFAGLLDPAEATAYARELLTPLSEPLRTTLGNWLALHGSWDRTATTLGVHRNTVRQRIARCAALLGADLDDMDVRTELWLALRHL
ncbi:PucR family transcriptional regulator ligand-binding domain-containing protein [Streptomyces sp. Edi4]|uniref:PucR family transcriptional regulator ligand-binding domain-containing protein n=1 Tax=Streptomyces sp. Edi4 TaxID=3162527 RepID=UPI003306712C